MVDSTRPGSNDTSPAKRCSDTPPTQKAWSGSPALCTLVFDKDFELIAETTRQLVERVRTD
jgi:hypothetical protein